MQLKEWFSEYPYGERLPESVVIGLRDDVVEKAKKQSGVTMEGGVVYPWPEMQHTTDVDEWFRMYSDYMKIPRTRQDMEGKGQKNLFWRKADAASIEDHLKKEGKLSEDSFKLVCRKIPSRREQKICNFSDKELTL